MLPGGEAGQNKSPGAPRLETQGRRNWVVARSSPGVASSVVVDVEFADDDAEEASFGVQQRSKPNWR